MGAHWLTVDPTSTSLDSHTTNTSPPWLGILCYQPRIHDFGIGICGMGVMLKAGAPSFAPSPPLLSFMTQKPQKEEMEWNGRKLGPPLLVGVPSGSSLLRLGTPTTMSFNQPLER